MFGKSFNGFIGTDLFFFSTNISQYQTYFVFQAMFVATAATIISGAVAERLKFIGYLIITVFSTGLDLSNSRSLGLVFWLSWRSNEQRLAS